MKHAVKTAKLKSKEFIIGLIFWIAVFSGFAMMVSCGTSRKKFESSDTLKVTDTTIYKKSIKVKDTVIIVPGARLKISVPASQLADGKPVETKTDRGSIILKKDGETIEAVCVIDDLVKVIQLQNTVIENYQKISAEKEKIEKTETKGVPFLTQVFANIGYVLLPGLLIYITITWIARKRTI
ncbi:hypothetical protein [Flavobacterium sp. UBA4197]|uniref:hypothetical protein n=1 Tax=Flavobacterium sp. UBA4197 TaxID=1946546 RepID=UPI00257E778A|nr:hypothetical protein [Flavobacterium sp. UBA4197]HRB72444.1 hypothetical protein [Flavobacterium sp.]